MSRPVAALVATALLSLASLRQSLSGAGPDVGFAVLVGIAIVVALTGRRTFRPTVERPWLGSLLLTAAVAIAVADRRLVVASRGFGPDELTLALLVVSIPLLALFRVRVRTRESVAIGLALAAYLFVGMAMIVGMPYHADPVIAPHRAAELLLAGRDPYREFDLLEAAGRFGLDPHLVTHFVDGSQVRIYDYPALSFLVVTPFVALGLTDLRWFYLAELLLLTLVLTARTCDQWRPLVPALVAGNVIVTRQYVLAGIDPTWLLLVVLAWLTLGRRWTSALAMGCAVAARQTAWFIAPFYVLAVWRRHGFGEAIRGSAIAAGVAVLFHLPFLLDAPDRVLQGVLTPILGALEPDGVGLIRLELGGLVPVLSREAHLVLALAAFGGAALLFHRRTLLGAGPALALAPLYVGWRSLQSYFAFVPLLSIVADPNLIRSTEHEIAEVR